jgi:hypothetical protein
MLSLPYSKGTSTATILRHGHGKVSILGTDIVSSMDMTMQHTVYNVMMKEDIAEARAKVRSIHDVLQCS